VVEGEASGFLWCVYFDGQCRLGASGLFSGRLWSRCRSLKADSSIVVGWTEGSPGAWKSVCSGVEFTQIRYIITGTRRSRHWGDG
jgi:hypothetical protein